jgi:hypothetical protein
MPSDEEKIQTIKNRLIAGNSLAALLIILGTVGFWLINPLFGWLFLGFSTFSVLVIIRRLLCSSCYYCKSCTKGFAKLSILFLGANSIPGLSKNSIIGMVAFIYLLLIVIPVAMLTNSILVEFSLLKIMILIGILTVAAIALISRVMSRNRALWKR